MNRDAYALHRPVIIDPQHAYCMRARATLDALAARKRVTVWGRIVSIFRKGV